MNKKIKALIAVGGTGGHVFPGINLAYSLIKKNYSIKIVTDKRGYNFIKETDKKNVLVFPSSPLIKKNVFKQLIKGLVKNKLVSDYSLYYLNFKSFSSQFYSLGSIEKINVDQLRNKLINKEKLRIIVEKSEINKLDTFIIERLIEIDDTGKKQMYVSDF